VSGVKAVVQKIEVELPGSHKRDDHDIAKAVVSRFLWNVQVPDKLIRVSVEDGLVELRGQVEWDFQRTVAEECVRGITGVKGVLNTITIKEKRVQPEKIKQKIEEALKRAAEREARRISVEVRDGQVTLSGIVNSFKEMQDARGVAFSFPGVKSVDNKLQIQS
jgi:osmotically-inducible protein OsmY